MNRIAVGSGGAAVTTLLLLSLLAPARPAAAQEPQAVANLLQPADTSSPRGVIRTFLDDSDFLVEDWYEVQGTSLQGSLAFGRLVATMDLSATPDGEYLNTQIRRFALLKEILDRVEIPPDEEIPEAEQVARDQLTRWVIPGTSIALEIRSSGPRAGEWAFSPGTVARLDRTYEVARLMPYKPGAAEGLYDDVLANAQGLIAEQAIRNRLKPIDTSSPRAALMEFVRNINRAHEIVMRADAALRADPPAVTVEEARGLEAQAANLLARATSALDLSDVPPARRADVGIEAALQIKEILDRLPLTPITSVPDQRFFESMGPSRPSSTISYRLPNTSIEIAEVTQGPRAGEFLFTKRTVARVGDFFTEVEDLPYREEAEAATTLTFVDPRTTEGFYHYYISTPGFLIPRVSALGGFVEGLPPMFHGFRWGHTTWQWLGLALIAAVTILIGVLAFWLVAQASKRLPSPLDRWMRLAAPIVIALVVSAAAKFSDSSLNVTGTPLGVVTFVSGVTVVIMYAWAALIFLKAAAESYVVARRRRLEPIDISLARIASRVVGFLVAAWIIVRGAQSLGADVLPLLAGLGVGGLAVALAAQKTLANFIGSLILFANKPVREGDYCQFGDQTGTVEKIGLHSTRIRTLERSIISIPNSDFSEMQLNNLALRDQRRFTTVLQLRYETTPEQMRYILVKLRELLLGHPMVAPDPARVRFVAFGAYSKDVEIVAYIRTNIHDKYLAACEDLLLRMEDVVVKAGSGFAFPSQTAYLAKDDGVDKESQTVAETNVQRWRALDKLPFPDFPEEDRDRLEDILDYPPKGSPGAGKA